MKLVHLVFLVIFVSANSQYTFEGPNFTPKHLFNRVNPEVGVANQITARVAIHLAVLINANVPLTIICPTSEATITGRVHVGGVTMTGIFLFILVNNLRVVKRRVDGQVDYISAASVDFNFNVNRVIYHLTNTVGLPTHTAANEAAIENYLVNDTECFFTEEQKKKKKELKLQLEEAKKPDADGFVDAKPKKTAYIKTIQNMAKQKSIVNNLGKGKIKTKTG